MTDETRTHIGTPTPEELRDQIEHTRDELGQTIEALAAKADVKAQVKEQAAEKAAVVREQVRAKAGRAAQLVKDKTPVPVQDKAGKAALAAGAALVVFLLVRRIRRRR
ncbi:DUF3618 domain-containing protein [Streptomyces sp. NPDC051578]|uniref:DUF3618 domain-containing protein n=1 Tax=Streptomyces sp. NPDC051578 TaxID=3365662 RepID=UPI00378BB9BF